MTMSVNLGAMRSRAKPMRANHEPVLAPTKPMSWRKVLSQTAGERRGMAGGLVVPVEDT